MSLRTPRPTIESEPFWAACRRGELVYQACSVCGSVMSYARMQCTACHSVELVWLPSARLGSVASFTNVHRAPSAEFSAQVPYTIALVDFDEGFRLMMNTEPPFLEDTPIGARVTCRFADMDTGAAVPRAVLVG